MTFSEQIVYAMFRPDKYKEMLSLKKGRSALFIIVMMLVLGIVNFAIPMGAFIASFGGFEELFDKKIGNISYHDGTLTDDREFDITFNDIHFIINTDEELVSDELLKKDGVYVAFGANAVRLVSVVDKSKTNYRTFYYKGIVPDGINNESLKNHISLIYGYLVFMFIISCVGYFLKYAFFALILGFLVGGAAKRIGVFLNSGQMFMLCFYAETLGMIISNFNTALGLLPSIVGTFIAVFISTRRASTGILFMKQGNNL